jgi:hypothetical protein
MLRSLSMRDGSPRLPRGQPAAAVRDRHHGHPVPWALSCEVRTQTMAMAAKNKEPASDSIMAPDKMKPLLALSKREPVQAAIGLTADGEGVILLDKKLKPKKLLALLKASAAKQRIQLQPSTLRFGKAEVDTDYDPGMVRFFVNKDPPGNMRVKLVEVVKRIPYQKVELNVDVAFEEELDDDQLKAAYETRMGALEPRMLGQLQAQRGDVSKIRAVSGFVSEKAAGGDFEAALKGLDTLEKLLDPVEPAAPPPPPEPPARPAARPADPAALAKAIAALARRIPEIPDSESEAKANLLKLANQANVYLKTNNLRYAADTIAQLRDGLTDALDGAGVGIGQVTPPSSGPPDGAGRDGAVADVAAFRAAWDKAGKAWQGAIETVDARIAQLQARLRSSPDAALQGIAERGMNDLTGNFKVKVMAAVRGLAGADQRGLAKAASAVVDLVEDFQDFLQHDLRVELCDSNPFGVPTEIRATLVPALAGLADALKQFDNARG